MLFHSRLETILVLCAVSIGSFVLGFVVSSTLDTPTFLQGVGSANEDRSSLLRAENRRTYGDLDAPITIVEFSDYSCGFCGRLHLILKRIIDESDGGVVWEYRHFPMLRELSVDAAIASECVADLSPDPMSFWRFSDRIFEDQQTFDSNWLVAEATSLGIAQADFLNCLADTQVRDRVQVDFEIARDLGARGTPYSVIIFEDGRTVPVTGAVPYEQWMRELSI